MIRYAILAWVFIAANASCARAQEKNEFDAWIEVAEKRIAAVDDYTAIFHRQVRVGGELREKETMLLKYKKPLHLYLKWIAEPHEGRELLYVEGENRNRIKVHGKLLLATLTLNIDPDNPFFTKSSRHRIDEVGIDYITRVLGREFRRGIAAGEISIRNHGESAVFGRKAAKFEGIFPNDVDKGYYCRRAIVCLDVETKIPIAVEVYDRENELCEFYGFEDLTLNAGLRREDFDPRNPEYKF
jgi:hypothetical protein